MISPLPCVERNRLTLQFADPQLEADYEVHERSTYLNRIRIGLSIATAATLTYLALSVSVLDERFVVTQFQAFVCLPLPGIALGLSFWLKRSFFPMLAGMLGVVMLGFPGVLLYAGPEISMFSVTGFVQSLLFITALVMVPFRYVMLLALPGTVLMIASLVAVNADAVALPHQLSMVTSFALLLGFVVYMREEAHRRSFLRIKETESLHQDDLLQKADQIDWLRNLPAQLERDMRNCLFAIETELDGMLDAKPADEAALRRARGGIHDMMKMFETVRFASDVDLLEQEQHEAVNLSRVVHEVVLDRSRDMEDVHAIELDVQSDVWIQGSVQLIRQSITQILNSATADLHPETLLQVVLKRGMREVMLEVMVREELKSLGPNVLTNERFQLGLGLYLARKIFELHSGEFEVVSENGATRFTARLPLHSPSTVAEESLVDQTC